MLSIPASLKSHATSSRGQALALCWKITRPDGTIYRFTDWPSSLSLRESDAAPLSTYSPSDGIDASARRRVDELETANNKEARGIISSTLIKTDDLRAGRFDGARVDEYLVDARLPWLGYIEHSLYFMRTVTYDRAEWRAQIEGISSKLDRPVGDVWGPTCRVALFSAACGLSPVGFQKTVTVSDILEDRKSFKVTFGGGVGVLWNANYYGNDGTLLWTAGANNALTLEIKEYTWDGAASKGTVTLHLPSPYAIVVADTGTIFPGCNKKSGVERDKTGVLQAGHCKDKFANLVNFQGEPAIPNRDNSLKGVPIR